MRNPLIALAGGLILLAAVSGCAQEAEPVATPQLPQVPEPVQEFANESVYYRCEGGFRVAVAGDTAQVATPAGVGVSLSREASGDTMEFVGEALAFSVSGEAAVLVQDEGGRFACTGVD